MASHTPADVDRLLDECETQGHPRLLSDPLVLAVIAGLLREVVPVREAS